MVDRSTEHKITKSFAEQRADGASPGASTAGMACPRCGSAITMITNTIRLLGQVRRYRQCVSISCRHKFVTKERIEKANLDRHNTGSTEST